MKCPNARIDPSYKQHSPLDSSVINPPAPRPRRSNETPYTVGAFSKRAARTRRAYAADYDFCSRLCRR